MPETTATKTKTHKSEVRSSKIRKGISRTINTAKFESVVIHDEIEEVVEWSSLEERQAKIDNWNSILISNFQKTHDEVMEQLGLGEKKAYFKTLEDKDNRADPAEMKNILDELDVAN